MYFELCLVFTQYLRRTMFIRHYGYKVADNTQIKLLNIEVITTERGSPGRHPSKH
jgi:hypothetical protein